MSLTLPNSRLSSVLSFLGNAELVLLFCMKLYKPSFNTILDLSSFNVNDWIDTDLCVFSTLSAHRLTVICAKQHDLGFIGWRSSFASTYGALTWANNCLDEPMTDASKWRSITDTIKSHSGLFGCSETIDIRLMRTAKNYKKKKKTKLENKKMDAYKIKLN